MLETAPGSCNRQNYISGLFSLCHVKVINPPPCKVDEIDHRSTSAETFASSGVLYLIEKPPTGFKRIYLFKSNLTVSKSNLIYDPLCITIGLNHL